LAALVFFSRVSKPFSVRSITHRSPGAQPMSVHVNAMRPSIDEKFRSLVGGLLIAAKGGRLSCDLRFNGRNTA
jgi:hypothetical protein